MLASGGGVVGVMVILLLFVSQRRKIHIPPSKKHNEGRKGVDNSFDVRFRLCFASHTWHMPSVVPRGDREGHTLVPVLHAEHASSKHDGEVQTAPIPAGRGAHQGEEGVVASAAPCRSSLTHKIICSLLC